VRSSEADGSRTVHVGPARVRIRIQGTGDPLVLMMGIGGHLDMFYFAFGTSDIYAVVDAPDNITAAAFALAVGGTGVAAHLKTIVLLTPDEVDKAAKKSATAGYRAPGA